MPKLQGFDHEKSLASGCNGCFDWDIAGMTMINGNVMGYSEVVMFFPYGGYNRSGIFIYIYIRIYIIYVLYICVFIHLEIVASCYPAFLELLIWIMMLNNQILRYRDTGFSDKTTIFTIVNIHLPASLV